MGNIRVAVIGVGHLGRLHALTYANSKKVNLAGVCDILKERTDAVARECKTEAFYDYHDLINKVDAASIVVPTTLHHPIACDFLKNGIHTLVEKPMTATLLEADELIRVAKKNGLILQVGNIERFNPAIKALYELAKHPRFIECHRLGTFKGT